MDNERLDRIIYILEEILKWTKVTSYLHVKHLLESTLKREEERLVYELTVEENSSERIVKRLTPTYMVAGRTVISWWDKWAKMGLITVISPKKRKKNFSLMDFGIEYPKLSYETEEKGKVTSPQTTPQDDPNGGPV